MTLSETIPKLSDANPVVVSIFRDAIRSAIPDTLLTVSEWADTYRYVSQGPQRGQRWKMSTVPYFIEPLNCITDPSVRRIVMWSSSRVGKTEGFLLNACGYFMHIDPSPIMQLRPTLDDAKLFSRERFSAFIEETPVLRDLVEEPRSRDSGNTILYKKFLGGYIFFPGSNSSTGLRAQDFRILLADEIDDYNVNAGGLGDPLDAAEVRLTNFEIEGLALSLLTSSPTIKGASRIAEAFAESDQRHLYVPCLGCGEYQEILWHNIVWTELGLPPKEACFKCPTCAHIGPEDEKGEMIRLGEWRAHAEFNGTVGFKLRGTYSPFITWGGMADRFVKARESKSDEKMQVWVNSTLGELWEPGEYLEEQEYTFHTEDYGGPDCAFDVPAGVTFLTFGADVHPDRIEVEVLGWGSQEENWSIDYKVLLGNPEEYPSAVWTDLEDYLEKDWRHELGVPMNVSAGAIDTRGHCTDASYKFAYKHRHKKWFPIAGANVAGKPIAPRKPSLVGKPRIKLRIVGTEAAKDRVSAMLRVENEGPRYCHVPTRYDEEWFKQMDSEHRTRTRNKRGFSVWVWEKKKPGARNEAWDCRVYNVIAKEIWNPNVPALRDRLLKLVERLKSERSAVAKPDPERDPTNDGETGGNRPPLRSPANFRKPQRRGGFIKNW